MKLTLDYNVTNEFLDNVMGSATESGVHGVDGWMTVDRWLCRGGFHASYDRKEDPEGERKGKVTIRRRDVLAGIRRLLTNKAIDISPEARGRLAAAVIDDDTGEIDGPLADLIIQAAVFNDVIYG